MKICPKCGAQIADTAKFCTSCGYAFPTAQTTTPGPTPVAPTPQSSGVTPPPVAGFDAAQAKAAGRNYWQYFVDSLLHPLNFGTAAHPYFGFVSMGILAIISTFNLWHFFANINNGITAFLKWFANILVMLDGGGESADEVVNSVLTTDVQQSIRTAIGNVSGATCFKFFLAFVVVVLLYLVLAFGIRHMVSGDTVDFMAFSVDFGRFFAPMIVVALLVTLFSFGGAFKVTIWLLMLNGMFFNVGFVALCLAQRKPTGFDALFATVIAEIVMTLIVLWLSRTITVGMVSGLVTALAKSFGTDSSGLTELLNLLKYL